MSKSITFNIVCFFPRNWEFLFQEYRLDYVFVTSMNITIFLLRRFLKLISFFLSRL